MFAIFNRKNVSVNHKIINKPNLEDLKNKYSFAWRNKEIPQRQWQLVKSQLVDPTNLPAFRILTAMIRQTKIPKPSVLEIGCSSGYHSEVFSKAGLKCNYQGCDISSEFMRLARRLYPKVKFKTADAIALPYRTRSFDIAVSGCCLLHIVDYSTAIKETARVAKKYVIFHRTPVITSRPTVFTTKKGYGVEMVEIFFNEGEFLALLKENGLKVISTKKINQFKIDSLDEPIILKNYLCQKI